MPTRTYTQVTVFDRKVENIKIDHMSNVTHAIKVRFFPEQRDGWKYTCGVIFYNFEILQLITILVFQMYCEGFKIWSLNSVILMIFGPTVNWPNYKPQTLKPICPFILSWIFTTKKVKMGINNNSILTMCTEESHFHSMGY